MTRRSSSAHGESLCHIDRGRYKLCLPLGRASELFCAEQPCMAKLTLQRQVVCGGASAAHCSSPQAACLLKLKSDACLLSTLSCGRLLRQRLQLNLQHHVPVKVLYSGLSYLEA